MVKGKPPSFSPASNSRTVEIGITDIRMTTIQSVDKGQVGAYVKEDQNVLGVVPISEPRSSVVIGPGNLQSLVTLEIKTLGSVERRIGTFLTLGSVSFEKFKIM